MKMGKIAVGALAGLMMITGCTSQNPTPTPEVTATPEVKPSILNYYTLTDENHPYPYVGIGAQYNGGLYNQLSRHSYGFTEADYPVAEQLIKAMGAQYIRIFYDKNPWEVPTNDNPNGYPIDTNDRASFRRVVELAQNTPNASVNLTYWHGPYTIPALNTQGTTDIKVPFAIPEMEDFANELYYLMVTRNFDCLKYITIQNEVNTAGYTKEQYEKLNRSLDYYLKQKGIRDRIDFVAELTSDNEAKFPWLSYFGEEMNDVLDGYAHHYYWHFDDTIWNNFQSRLSNMSNMMYQVMSVMPADQRKPTYIAEYGVRGFTLAENATTHPDKPGVSAPNDPNAVSVPEMTRMAWQIANFQIVGLNLGVVGFSRWDAFRAKYNGEYQDHSAINHPNDDLSLRPVYYVHQLIAAATVPGSDIMKLRSVPGTNTNKMTALRAPDGNLTFMMSQLSDKPRTMVVDELEPGQEFHLYYWNENGDGLNTYKGKISVDKWGRLSVALGVETMAVVTEVALTGVIVP